jgi:hypothetical protein
MYLLKNKFEVFDKVIQFKDLTVVENFKWISSTNIVKRRNSRKIL